jgi:hypothetical protein
LAMRVVVLMNTAARRSRDQCLHATRARRARQAALMAASM